MALDKDVVDCRDKLFLRALDGRITDLNRQSRGPRGKQVLRLGGVGHLASHLDVQGTTLLKRLQTLRDLAAKRPGFRVEVQGEGGAWEELDLGEPVQLAEALSLGLPPRVRPQHTAPRSRPVWIDKTSKTELFHAEGVWAVWTALRLYFEGHSLSEIAATLGPALPGAEGVEWKKDRLSLLLKNPRLCPPPAAVTEAPRPYLLGTASWRMIQHSLPLRKSVDSGPKRRVPQREHPAQRLIRGIHLECAACRAAVQAGTEHPETAADIDLSGPPEGPAHPRCLGQSSPLRGLTRAQAAARALQHIAERVQRDRMRFYEVANPFIDDKARVLKVVAQMTDEFEQGARHQRPPRDEGPHPWVLLDRVHRASPARFDHADQVLAWLSDPPEDPRVQRQLWLALTRRFGTISLGAAAGAGATPRHRTEAQQSGVLYHITDIAPAPDGRHDQSTVVRMSVGRQSLGFGEFQQPRVLNRAGPAFRSWVGPVRQVFHDIRLETEGLGAWQVTHDHGVPTRDEGWEPFVRAMRRHLRENPLEAIVLIDPADPELCASDDDDWLGSYRSNSRLSKRKQQGGTVFLYPTRITDVAAQLGCSPLQLAELVLRHECGHHVAPTSPDDEARSLRGHAAPARLRAEAGAQLFAWLTSEHSGRNLLAKLAARQKPPYTAYQHVIDFATGALRPSAGAGSLGLRPGWLLAWATVRSARCSEFQDLPKDAADLEELQAQWLVLANRYGHNACWPLLTHLSLTSATVFAAEALGAFAIAHHRPGSGWVLKVMDLFALMDTKLPNGAPFRRSHKFVNVVQVTDPRHTTLVIFQRRPPGTNAGPLRVYAGELDVIETMVEDKHLAAELRAMYAPADD